MLGGEEVAFGQGAVELQDHMREGQPVVDALFEAFQGRAQGQRLVGGKEDGLAAGGDLRGDVEVVEGVGGRGGDDSAEFGDEGLVDVHGRGQGLGWTVLTV